MVELFGGVVPNTLEDLVKLPASAQDRETSSSASGSACRGLQSTRT